MIPDNSFTIETLQDTSSYNYALSSEDSAVRTSFDYAVRVESKQDMIALYADGSAVQFVETRVINATPTEINKILLDGREQL